MIGCPCGIRDDQSTRLHVAPGVAFAKRDSVASRQFDAASLAFGDADIVQFDHRRRATKAVPSDGCCPWSLLRCDRGDLVRDHKRGHAIVRMNQTKPTALADPEIGFIHIEDGAAALNAPTAAAVDATGATSCTGGRAALARVEREAASGPHALTAVVHEQYIVPERVEPVVIKAAWAKVSRQLIRIGA